MQIPQPHLNITRVKSIFEKIYNRGQISLSASKTYLEEQLNLYLDHLSAHTGHKVSVKDRARIWNIIERNNQVAKILSTPGYRKIIKRKRQLSEGVSLGFVFCIDGRIPTIFLGGRFARHFEIPAAEISVIKRKSDGKLIPDSSDLNEALRRTSTTGNDLLEIVLAHTSLFDPHHGCGAMLAKKKTGLLDPKLSLEENNLKIIKEKTITAISNMYNEFREQLGLEPQKIVAIPAVYDTDSFGIILNFESKKVLSTTSLANKYKDQLDEYFVKKNIVLGSFRQKFTDLKYLTVFSQNILSVTEAILDQKVASELQTEVENYLNEFYQDLTANQKKTLKFVLIRNIALQYLTGFCLNIAKIEERPFSKHEESYMAVAMRGSTIGKFDPENQAFASTPADPRQAIENINTMLSIMHGGKNEPYILFVCNSVGIRDLKDNNQVLQRIIGSNAGLLRDIIEDKGLGEMIETGKIIPVPVLIDEDAREVLKIVDHSGYI
ncbi:hypothetical protein HYU93_00985 [Candidatus Daviesbacteria bacterium]|nr:hypothetical protein [Candidatus Daviesbacteria bacterium]